MTLKKMSESSNSFEEIEFEQSALSGSSTSEQESSGPTNNDQLSNSKSSATTMSGSTEDQAKSMQLEDLEFELGWKTRDEIMCTLSQHTTLLSGLIIQEDAREKVRKANADLIVKLLNLPLKVAGRWRIIESPECSPDGASNEVLLDLSSEVRSRIVDTLMVNHNIALLEFGSVSSDCKAKLIDRNRELIGELVRLRSRIVSKGDHRIEKVAKASEPQTISKAADGKLDELNNSKRSDRNVDTSLQLLKTVEQSVTGQTASSPTAEEVANLKDELEKLKDSVISSLKENVRDLEEKLAESLKRMDVYRTETTYTWVLKGVDALLADSTKELRSEFFHCRGMPWYLGARRWPVDGAMDHLGAFLYIQRTNDQDSCNIVADYELRLLSSTPGSVCSDVFYTSKGRTFKSSSQQSAWGWVRFITVDKLRAGSFIQDDTIKIQVHLTTKSFERVWQAPKN